MTDFLTILIAGQYLLVDRFHIVDKVILLAEPLVVGLASREVDFLVFLRRLIYPSTSSSQAVLILVVVELCPSSVLQLTVSTGVLLSVIR